MHDVGFELNGNSPATEASIIGRPPVTLTDLPPSLQAAVTQAGWPSLMPVQMRAIPYILAEEDVLVQARTGSGKTGAFILPMLERLDPTLNACQALVLAPTRELANQVAEQAEILAGNSGIRCVPVYGGVSYGPQTAAFRKGAHLVVGTPGRILDHLISGNFSLEHIKLLIFDEADRMLSVGFYPDMKAVQRFLPKRRVNTCMFSATFPPYVIRLANEFMQDQVVISLSSDHVHVTDVVHNAYTVGGMDKDRALVRLIEVENPESALIFCNTKVKVNYVTVVLQRFGYDADQLSGDLAQVARERVLGRIRQGTLRFLVATDVAARGIDIADLSHVIQYEVPDQAEAYIHRAGRTGRAGASGTAITFCDLLEQVRLNKIVKQYAIDMQHPEIPTDEDVADVVGQRATVRLLIELRAQPPAVREKMQAYAAMAELLTMDADGIHALAMLIDDYYHAAVHAPREEGPVAVLIDGPTKPIDEREMHRIALALANAMTSRDKLKLERAERFEQLVEELAMDGEGFNILTMLLYGFHQRMRKG